ncbi:MAG: hypothetical protein UZ21_OP11001000296 [Microgenomates bacterium OLB22]|nr:MAG: hypothetical protein UZ21_OP11001000296 [Microgenomates bacterium OLB22]
MQEVENRCRIDMKLIDETLAFTRDIYATYKDAPPFMKRHYLRFFYDRITIKNKKVFEAIPTPIFATLRDNLQVIQKTLVLPNVSALRTHFLETEEEYEPIFLT